jgi:hypothetical protein
MVMVQTIGLLSRLPNSWVLPVVLSALVLSACATQPREAREVSVEYFAEYQACKEQALSLDASAREQKSPAQYATAARILDRCAAEGEQAGSVPSEELMQLRALSVLTYIKAGEIETAKDQFLVFRNRYAGHDLYFSDNTSYIDTIDVLLWTGVTKPSEASVLNARSEVLSEERRRRYWASH